MPVRAWADTTTPHGRLIVTARRDTGTETLTDIARSYNVSHSTISPLMIDRRVRKLGVRFRPGRRGGGVPHEVEATKAVYHSLPGRAEARNVHTMFRGSFYARA